MATTFELTKNEKGEFHFRLVGSQGKTLLRSEGYTAKASAKKGIESVRANAQVEGRLVVLEASDGRPYVNLKAANGQVVATSPMFPDAAACEAGARAIRAEAGRAQVVDKT